MYDLVSHDIISVLFYLDNRVFLWNVVCVFFFNAKTKKMVMYHLRQKKVVVNYSRRV